MNARDILKIRYDILDEAITNNGSDESERTYKIRDKEDHSEVFDVYVSAVNFNDEGNLYVEIMEIGVDGPFDSFQYKDGVWLDDLEV